MDKNVRNTITELEKKIETLQAKKEAVLKKEKARKDKAQEKWKQLFLKELNRHIVSSFGDEYEETILPEKLALLIGEYIAGHLDTLQDKASAQEKEDKHNNRPEDGSIRC